MHKRFASLILVSFLVVSAIVLTLAYRANVELERVVSAQFNEQQLLLARKIAQDISHDFELLNEALLHFSRSTFLAPETNADETSAIGDLLGFLKDFGVLGLGFSASGGPSAVLTDEGWTTLDELGVHLPEQEDGKAPGSFSPNVVLSRTQRSTHGPIADRWVMTMVAPMQDKGSQGLSGTDCLFVLDAQSIARSAAEGVRSGKTGYAWVIDGQGHFMYHVEAEFVGQDAFTARHKRNPDLSYKRINSLMSERLLKGEEGTDWYVSGWHWDMIREMKKLFAFSPVIFSRNGTGPVHVWSVGLAAPDSEVYGLIQPVVLRQGAVVGIFGISALLGFAAFLFLSLHWSQSLRAEVARKTEYLQRSEDELRRERDKVSRSMEELLETQEKLMISERFAAIGEAAAHLSHEIKNPLMVMGGFAGQILRTLPEDDPRREKLKIIADEANRLEHLLTEVR
ncbi:MAG: two-component sensor histidine kinase, partial [Deltaproteobacteria bacterium]|nr:two-component sensor histidine kinase [Deltaproteobacteria bacterium]